ncbi:two-component system, NtrC family, response regulator AtoC [Seinonella peptonophila]|uniref:Two-component system, NtrC family, response regulator AtoC n=2 Tax=Seinonella peptonophila TaxID=112248 RepID=A0A1M4U2W2_9BACL|nr:two-component system, NtrC family, response regulator AtoC [Seinonella peptonophila]
MIIDDEPSICQSLAFALEDHFHVYTFTDPEKAIPLFKKIDIAFVLLDLKVGKHGGLDILQDIKRISPATIVIMITAYGSIPSSVEAMHKGAFSYVTKPIHLEELMVLLERAEEFYTLHSKVQWLGEALEQAHNDYGFIGKSPKMQEVFRMLDQIRKIESNVLITGESGTGKELMAKIIHYQSPRHQKRFQTINCAAIPEGLLESELFGHERGAFTGATEKKLGLFSLADGGTVFLDEIGEMELNLQGKLLRVIQERKVSPVGGTIEKPVDFRLISATNRDLYQEIQNRQFRQDLYYRLNVIPIHLPPLRERKEDIPLLVEFFLNKLSHRMGKPVEGISEEALQVLLHYDYPGNVRELQNIIERAIALTNSSVIQTTDLPEEMKQKQQVFSSHTLIPIYVGESIQQVEKKVIQYNLAAMGGNRRKTAQIIGIGERTLREKLKKYETE